MQGKVLGVEHRRRWSAAEKVRLVAAMNEPGAVVTEIARREGTAFRFESLGVNGSRIEVVA
jgi:transposase-like protein